jgi:RHS repeat-associated protein
VNTYDPKLKFSGKERDSDSGLDYFGARHYNHSSYRFISVDPAKNRVDLLALSSSLDNPIGTYDISFANSKTDVTRNYFIDTQDARSNPQLWNLYSFNRNNPLVFLDPTGLSYLHFSRSSQKLTLYDNTGKMIDSWDASNNTSRGYEPFPLGTWNIDQDTMFKFC